MSDDPHGARNIPIGTQVVGYGGTLLGHVREVHPHYILVSEDSQHSDLDIPVHAIVGFEDGTLQVSVNRESSTHVDDVETAHRLNEAEGQSS